MTIPIRRYVRRNPASQRRPWSYSRDLSRTDRERIDRILDDIMMSHKTGYTYTGGFRFDVNDPKSMARFYEKLGGDRQAFVIATTNRRLVDFDIIDAVIGFDTGIGFWVDDDSVVYADDVRLFFDISNDEALRLGREYGQRYILKLDGKTRTHEFIKVTDA